MPELVPRTPYGMQAKWFTLAAPRERAQTHWGWAGTDEWKGGRPPKSPRRSPSFPGQASSDLQPGVVYCVGI